MRPIDNCITIQHNKHANKMFQQFNNSVKFIKMTLDHALIPWSHRPLTQTSSLNTFFSTFDCICKESTSNSMI